MSPIINLPMSGGTSDSAMTTAIRERDLRIAAESARDEARAQVAMLREALKAMVELVEEQWRNEGWDPSPTSGQVPHHELTALGEAQAALAITADVGAWLRSLIEQGVRAGVLAGAQHATDNKTLDEESRIIAGIADDWLAAHDAKVRADEREACAVVARAAPNLPTGHSWNSGIAEWIASRIRARSEAPDA